MEGNSKIVSELAKEPILIKIFFKIVLWIIYSLIRISNKKNTQKLSCLFIKRDEIVGVNFIMFLRANFSYEHCFCRLHLRRKSCQNDICTKNLYVKCWWNLHLVFVIWNFDNIWDVIVKNGENHQQHKTTIITNKGKNYVQEILSCYSINVKRIFVTIQIITDTQKGLHSSAVVPNRGAVKRCHGCRQIFNLLPFLVFILLRMPPELSYYPDKSAAKFFSVLQGAVNIKRLKNPALQSVIWRKYLLF